MLPSDLTNLLLFHNTSAGSGDTAGQDLVAAFREAGFTVRYRTKREGLPPLEDLAAVDAIVVAGGDGTVADVLTEVAASATFVTIVPLGGANNIAASLGFPPDPRAVASGLRSGRVRDFRLGLVQDAGARRFFVEACGCGVIAATLAGAKAAKPASGGYDKIRAGRDMLLARVRDAAPLHSRFRIDGSDLEGDLLFVEALNVSPTGPSLSLAPNAEPGADRLHVAILREDGRGDFMDALAQRLPPPVEVVCSSLLEMDWVEDALRIDDELLSPPAKPRPMRVSPSDIVVPVILPGQRTTGPETPCDGR